MLYVLKKSQRIANVYRIKGYLNQFANGHKTNFIQKRGKLIETKPDRIYMFIDKIIFAL